MGDKIKVFMILILSIGVSFMIFRTLNAEMDRKTACFEIYEKLSVEEYQAICR